MRVLGLFASLLVAWAVWGESAKLEFLVVDSSDRPARGVRINIAQQEIPVASTETDENGRAVFPALPGGRFTFTATKPGFETVRRNDVSSGGSIELTLVPTLEHHENIEVNATAEDALQQTTPPPAQLKGETAKALPKRPETVSDALPMLPGIVRSPAGDLEISGANEQRSSLIVNSADVTDPATGQFGLTVPIDSVATLNFYQTPFLAEYGRFTAGLVSVETRRGGEKWKVDFNDPFPDFRIRSWHMRGVRDATPRLNAEGPVIKGKLYFSEGLEYEVRNIEVRTLPFPYNQKRKQGFNSFAQIDWVATQNHLLTGTVHIAPQRLGYANLDYFNPQPTAADAATHNYTGTIADRLGLFGGVLENTFSVTRFDANVWGRGTDDLIVTPSGNQGSYFGGQNREAGRFGWLPTYSLPLVGQFGTNSFKLGAYFARSTDQGEVTAHPVDIVDALQRPLERIDFLFGRPFQMSDREYSFFAQDHWSISSRVGADMGVRTESQVLSHSFRVAPRAGIAWLPFANTGTVVRAGFGVFYDRVPLNVYSFNRYPKQQITYFDESGAISGGPFYFQNTLGEGPRSPFVLRKRGVAGNFSPRSGTASIQVEQSVSHLLKLRAGYMENQSAGLVIMQTIAPDPETNIGAHELAGGGTSRYRQFEVTARVQESVHRQFFFSYVKSRSTGDINDFSGYLGSFSGALIRPNYVSSLAGDIPNRYLMWGTFDLPLKFSVAPILEYRNGFPYSIMDAAQNYVGLPNRDRYRNFVSLDSRFSKDLRMNDKYSVRLSVAGYNMTNHYNPEAFHNNVADPAYGLFFGSRGRRFTADFDVLF
jgi:hypothetical protein